MKRSFPHSLFRMLPWDKIEFRIPRINLLIGSPVLIVLITSISTATISQIHLKGKVVDGKTNTAIPYANIGIINTRIGTISDGDGTFSLAIPGENTGDTLTFSALGYKLKSIPVSALSESIDILLFQNETLLQEVTVRAKKDKVKEWELGNRYEKGGLNMSSGVDANAGASVALLIENKYPSYHEELRYPVFLESAKLKISDNTTGPFKIRVRLYEVDSLTGAPGVEFLDRSIILESDIKKGWIDFDISQYNIQVPGPFFLAFEWIMEESERNQLKEIYRNFEQQYPERVVMDSTLVDGKIIPALHYIHFLPGTAFGVSLLPFSLEHYTCYSRYNSLGKWERAAYILTARVSVRQ
ncbi:carboxypeptidase-like regulatory domain-containing protein [Algoriphagus aestuariicola]|uniref:Carboxypeptidase-like regulatory domain-containing protein n=1 Tax=Algoriphagus aestuariicola TaxID=1852016 RepID=A0ABS3BVL6_9BACT|nr:carboxypeptidase-like regulatory domain-containing protein [Algoriphagus aestuariicola]MBN7803120.1 carboxypeptidase-like regulatory domain-containing protein [Algoriphagus aestuariicola]